MAILQQHARGKIDLDAPVSRYVASLPTKHNDKSQVEWDRISIRSLMSHFGGIQDNYAQEDLLIVGGASFLGLPPVSSVIEEALPACELNSTIICSTAGMLRELRTASPVLPPHVEISYSNVGYDLLGLVIEKVTGMAYVDYIHSAIIGPLGLNATTFSAPNAGTGIIPVGESQWDADLGVGNPSGGIYSSSDDMSRFLRYVLNNYQTISPTINWFAPAAFTAGSHSLLGIPWEIFRTTAILTETNRPVTFATKGGGLDGYYSYSIIVPDYDLVVSILLAGELTALNPLLDTITVPLIQAAEELAQQALKQEYTGTYVATTTGLNSSITLSQSASRSLHISQWTSNGTEMLAALDEFVAAQAGDGDSLYYQLIPTFETRHTANASLTGEVWRFYNVFDTPAETNVTSEVWNDYCITNMDPIGYAGKPLLELVFWRDERSVKELELSAFRVVLTKT
ncbi:hypothetical protein LTR65_003589 [Meristemomyces frigidus]